MKNNLMDKAAPNNCDIDPSVIFELLPAGRTTSSVRLIPSGVSLERRCDNERDWEPDRNHHDYQPHDPTRDLQEGENLRGNLDQQPADNRVSYCNR